MEHRPGRGRTNRTAGVKKVKSKELEVKRLPWEGAGDWKYVNVFEEYKESRAVPFFCLLFFSLQRSCIFELVFLLYTVSAFSLLFFIDKSKYFPGRQLSVMIWTAASAISASASWGRMRRMETILATSLSLLLSLLPPDASVFISLKNPLSHHLCFSALPHAELFFSPCFIFFSLRPRLNTSYLCASLFLSLSPSLSLPPFSPFPSVAPLPGWLIVTPQLRGWHMHQSLTNPTWSPENTLIH